MKYRKQYLPLLLFMAFLVLLIPTATAQMQPVWQRLLTNDFTGENSVVKASGNQVIFSNLNSICNSGDPFQTFSAAESITQYDIAASGNTLVLQNLDANHTGANNFQLTCSAYGVNIQQTVPIEVRDKPNTTLSGLTQIIQGSQQVFLANSKGILGDNISGATVRLYNGSGQQGSCVTNSSGDCTINLTMNTIGNFTYYAQTQATGYYLSETDQDGSFSFMVVAVPETINTSLTGPTSLLAGQQGTFSINATSQSGAVNGANVTVYNLTDNTSMGNCISLADGVCPINITFSNAGAYTLYSQATANGYNADNDTDSRHTVNVYTIPVWSNIQTSPTSPVPYSLGVNYQFNATWAASLGISTVLMEHNFTGALQNYSVSGSNGTEYFYNYTNLAVGDYQWRMYANDSAGNRNETPVQYYTIFENIPPQWFNISVSPASPTNYSEQQGYQFNVTWNGTLPMGTVIIEHDFTGTLANYSVNNISSVYYYDQASLAAGTYQWRMYANNTFGGTNTTAAQTYVVNKSEALLNITANPGFTVNEGVSVTLTCTRGSPQITTFLLGIKGGNSSGNGGGDTAVLIQSYAPGNYTVECGSSATQNYSLGAINTTLEVLALARPNITFITGNTSGTTGDNLLIELNATDNGQIMSTLIEFGGVNNSMNGSAGQNASFNHTLTMPSNNISTVFYSVYVFDNESLVTQGGPYSINVSDNDNPGITGTNQVVNESIESTLSVTASDNIAIDKFVWNFGDGTNTTTNTSSANHTYLINGMYVLQVTVNDTSGNINSTSMNITVLDNTANDFAILSLNGPSLINIPNMGTYNATIQNQGWGNESSTVRLFIDGTQITNVSVVNVTPGEKIDVLLNWTPTQEYTNANATVDIVPVSGEVDLADNTQSMFTTVRGVHDIAVNFINYSKQTAYLFDTQTVFGNVTNEGNVNETSVNVELVDISNNASVQSQTVDFSAGETKTISFNWTPQVKNFHTLRIRTTPVQFETDLVDNQQSTQVRVYSVQDSFNLSFAHPTLFPNANEAANNTFFFWVSLESLAADDLYDVNLTIDTDSLSINNTKDGSTLDYKNYGTFTAMSSDDHWWLLDSGSPAQRTISASIGYGADKITASRPVTIQ